MSGQVYAVTGSYVLQCRQWPVVTIGQLHYDYSV